MEEEKLLQEELDEIEKNDTIILIQESIERDKEKKQKREKAIIDLDSLQIIAATVEQQKEALDFISKSRPTTQVVCTQSGYGAKLASVTYEELLELLYSNETNYEYKSRLYKKVFSKIKEFSAKAWKPSFDEWLEQTAFLDYNTLMYGIFCSTYPDSSELMYECPHCGKTIRTKIHNSELIRTDNTKMLHDLTEEISKHADTKKEIEEFSLVSAKKSNLTPIKLPNSEFVVTIKLPTLKDVLKVYKELSESELLSLSSEELDRLIFVKDVYVPQVKDGVKTELVAPVEELTDRIMVLRTILPDDGLLISDEIYTKLENNHITYSISNKKCKYCGETGTVAIDMEALLFFQISGKR